MLADAVPTLASMASILEDVDLVASLAAHSKSTDLCIPHQSAGLHSIYDTFSNFWCGTIHCDSIYSNQLATGLDRIIAYSWRQDCAIIMDNVALSGDGD